MCKILITEILLLKMRISCTQTFEVDLQEMGCHLLKLSFVSFTPVFEDVSSMHKGSKFRYSCRNAPNGAMCRPTGLLELAGSLQCLGSSTE